MKRMKYRTKPRHPVINNHKDFSHAGLRIHASETFAIMSNEGRDFRFERINNKWYPTETDDVALAAGRHINKIWRIMRVLVQGRYIIIRNSWNEKIGFWIGTKEGGRKFRIQDDVGYCLSNNLSAGIQEHCDAEGNEIFRYLSFGEHAKSPQSPKCKPDISRIYMRKRTSEGDVCNNVICLSTGSRLKA